MPGIETALTYDIGTDQAYDFTIYTDPDNQTTIREITGWSLSFMVKRKATDADLSALVTKTTSAGIVIGGTFNADPDVNTQTATVTIADTDTDGLYPGLYAWELKRMDSGSEARLAFGSVLFHQTVHRT